ncbi:unnamed protein product (macronuclear) [Paramecium tetraurelia]|uniref:Uncharacterized protein n=1 Tax=Paramecium tetraurelia TaxID=5888 RepID=A0BNY0_PARTE|nr:uncharacterized protein GSPATT00030886001 [Paramecium tetraurelia]CAK60247.1 unnamed protein product [Paramecium tetraurelia]|eukprot:XP_001427645.1 hypothetical protein (macronuclear) [Paramecium tetraurelia strain d4-2]
MFNNPSKLQQIYFLTQFMALEKSLNLTAQKAQENANFALELWVNAEKFINQTSDQKQNKSILNIVNSYKFQNIIPQDQEGWQATQNYIDEWKNQTDDNKSIILQYALMNINQMIESDPAKFNQTNLIEQMHNQTSILDNNQKNKNTSKYISPFSWQHANVSEEEMIVAHFFENAKSQNITVQEYFNKLSFIEAASLLNALEKFYNVSSNNGTPSKAINSKGEQPTDEPQELLPEIKPKDSEDHPIYLYVVFSLVLIVFIVVLFFLRRYYIQQRIISFQMNEESNTQGLQV